MKPQLYIFVMFFEIYNLFYKFGVKTTRNFKGMKTLHYLRLCNHYFPLLVFSTRAKYASNLMTTASNTSTPISRAKFPSSKLSCCRTCSPVDTQGLARSVLQAMSCTPDHWLTKRAS